MKIVYGLDGDSTIPVVGTSVEGEDIAEALPNLVGAGNPYYAFDSLPPEVEGNIAWDPSGAPTCANDVEENRQAIRAMLDNPPTDKVFAAP
jgi:hypothetical protein